MKRIIILAILAVMLLSLFVNGCSPYQTALQPASTAATSTSTPVPPAKVYLETEIPQLLQSGLKQDTSVEFTTDKNQADLSLSLERTSDSQTNLFGNIRWIYALEAPFPTVTDDISLNSVENAWRGTVDDQSPFTQLLVSAETKNIFDLLWGEASSAIVQVVDEGQLATNDFKSPTTWAIVPFDQIAPRWKVISIDGSNPLDKPLDTEKYELKADFGLSGKSGVNDYQNSATSLLSFVPQTNRDESKMTVLMMTGTTAMVRAIAYKMEIKGLDYPIEKVKDWFRGADLIHVSNEVSFNPDCPAPNPEGGMQMCSATKYLQTLQDLGVNVVELTGNHENDYGSNYFESTIDTYNQLGWKVFGGGKTPEEAQAPVTLEVNGNKIAFIGCNPEGPVTDWASDKQAGAAKCDMDYMTQQINSLKSQGYVVISTFQQFEVYNTYIYGDELADVFRQAANAGADIVSGSEAHYAMGFQFMGNSIIHFGLGNFLFDQMAYQGVPDGEIQREFIDRHIIYNGKYINTQLLTAQLKDWAQPNPMDAASRAAFLTDVFNGSLWSKKNEGN